MKFLVTNYSFDPVNMRVTFNDFTSLSITRILLITAYDAGGGSFPNGTIIYNFAAPALGGYMYAPNVLQLYYTPPLSPYSTTKLQIFIDDEKKGASNEVLDALYEISTRLEFLAAVRGVSADLRVSPLSTPNMSTLFNLAALGGWSANTEVKNWDNLTAINSNINNVA